MLVMLHCHRLLMHAKGVHLGVAQRCAPCRAPRMACCSHPWAAPALLS